MKKYHLLTAILLLSLVSCTQDERSPGFNSLSDSIFSKLQEYVGIYYTSSELTKFLEPYNDAF